jgi:glycine oxidase
MVYDAAVIGGGAIGSLTAFHLADRGARVLLIDNGREQVTKAAGGMLSPSFERAHDAADPDHSAFLFRSLKSWDVMAPRIAGDPFESFGYRRDGVFGIGFYAPPGASVAVRDRRALPAFSRPATAFAAEEGSLEPVRLVAAARDAAKLKGAEFRIGHAVLRGEAIEVDGARVLAEHIVLATGADPSLAPGALQRVRGRAFLVRLAEEDQGSVPSTVRSPNVYFVPRTDGTVYIGATEEWPGAIAATPDDLWADALALLPCLGRAERLTVFDGMRPFISRQGPLIGRDEALPRLIRAQGHHRNGVLLGALTAQTVHDLIVA